MSDQSDEPIPFPRQPPPHRPRLRKLRLLAILLPLAALALVSTVFGMMMAVASDLPALENRQEYKAASNSILLDVRGRQLGILTGNQNRVLVPFSDINPSMINAIIAIEDERFYTNSGVDLRAIARAFVADVFHSGGVQGGSTITQQFVKVALETQDDRTIFEKLREAALAYHLTRKWPKEKILTEYLNAIYYGNGAYGIESAARTYFGRAHPGCGASLANPCAKALNPWESAMLAGIVQNPSGYDPIAHPQAARQRRNTVLRKMEEQGRITPEEYTDFSQKALPAADDLEPPHESAATPATPYFTTWVRQQIVDRFGAARAFGGGLQIRTTLDLDYQRAAEDAVNRWLPAGSGPSAAVVVIDNKTGGVRAMVGGRDYNQVPFNLATQGQRQPGSSFKPFILAQALREGISPTSLWPSEKRVFTVPHTHGREHFVVNNFEDSYSGTSTLERALTYSDNSVFAAVGIKVGTKRVARLAKRMGIRTPVSHNYAMTLGGLRQGVTPLDMAHAYETFAEDGRRITGTLGASDQGPVGIVDVRSKNGSMLVRNKVRSARILPADVATTAKQIMATVVTSGTGRSAALDEFAAGKTGTTENYGDAWFVGYTDRYTAAVWVGYPDRLKPMETEFQGGPVEGGTYPALIWHDVMSAIESVDSQREAQRAQARGETTPTTTTPVTPPASGPSAPPTTPSTTTPATPDGTAPDATGGATDGGTTGGGTTGGDTGGDPTGGAGGDTGAGGTQQQQQQAPAPQNPPPTPTPPSAPTPDAAPAPPPGSGGDTGGTAAPSA